MREEKLVIRPFEDLQILDYESIQEVNEHAQAELRGRIPFDRKEDYMKVGKRQTWAQVVAISAEEEFILFWSNQSDKPGNKRWNLLCEFKSAFRYPADGLPGTYKKFSKRRFYFQWSFGYLWPRV